MAAPTFIYKHDGGSSSATPTAPGAGTILANDICLFGFETFNQAVTIPTPGTGWTTWTEVANSPQSPSANTRLTVFWARSTQTDPTMPTSNAPGDHIHWAFTIWRGCETSGNPWATTIGSTENTSDTSGSATGGTTSVTDTTVVLFAAGDLPDAASTTEFSAWACTGLTSVTERADRAFTTGNGGSIGCASGTIAAPGAYGPFTYTKVTAAVKAHLIVELKPPTGTPTSDAIFQRNRTMRALIVR